jgi:hypothetical protein
MVFTFDCFGVAGDSFRLVGYHEGFGRRVGGCKCYGISSEELLAAIEWCSICDFLEV